MNASTPDYALVGSVVTIHVSDECPECCRLHGTAEFNNGQTGKVRSLAHGSYLVHLARFGNEGSTHPFAVIVNGHLGYFAAHELSTNSPLGQEVLARHRNEIEVDESRLVRIEP